MKLGRALVVFVFSAATIGATAQGCQDPTQVTLELSLDKKAACAEIAAGTAITVGVEPYDTERRVESGFVTARTTECDSATNQIGTLVVTPSDPGKASVVVVVGYKDNAPTTCKPPSYDGCIVARRRFAFAEHTRLRMPITIDPDCAGVPCDAFSTCNKGRCYDAATTCSGSECESPGELEDGGVDEAGVVEPDASGFDSGPGKSDPQDSGQPDAPVVPDGGGETFCTPSNTLVCNGISCGAGLTCCGQNPGGCTGSCPAPTEQLCCVNDAQDGCPQNYKCARAGSEPGRCKPIASLPDGSVPLPVPPHCDNGGLTCGGMSCGGTGKACCGVGGMVPSCQSAGSCQGTRYCCTNSDCGGMGTCTPGGPGVAGTCGP